MRRVFWALLVVLLIPTGPARADMGLVMDVQGNSELFKECEFSIGFDAPEAYASAVLGYEIHINDTPTFICNARWTRDANIDTSCDAPGFTGGYTCETMTKVRPVSLSCFDAAGADLDCGQVRLYGPEIFSLD